MQISQIAFDKCINVKDSQQWLAAFNTWLPSMSIKTETQVAMFLAQTGHESGDFKFLSENLNYSKEGLLATFPKYFTPVEATNFARKPEQIANKVYSNRMGNGTFESGDGWNYRGRGLIQITGKDNYTKSSTSIYGNLTLVSNPNLVSTNKETALLTALWFWKVNKLDTLNDIVVITKKINGGTNGLSDRSIRYSKYLEILKLN